MPLHKYVNFRHNVKVIIKIIIVFMSVENNDFRKYRIFQNIVHVM